MATTISISHDTKNKLRNLGRAGESYDDVITKMYAVARKHMLMTFLYDEEDSVDVDEAITQARKKWPKSA